MISHFKYILISIFFLSSCSSFTEAKKPVSNGKKLIETCISALDKKLNERANRAYIEEFKKGYTIAFTHGEAGTFGKRDLNYEQLLVCGISNNKVVFLGKPFGNASIDLLDEYPYENHQEEVIESLYLKEGEGFKYCCSQVLDEKNLLKYNPDIYK